MIQILIAALIGLAVASDDPAPAAGKKKGDPATAFRKRDKNGDALLTQDEFDGPKVKDFDKSKAHFLKLDANADGKLSLEEYKAGAKAKSKAKANPAKAKKAEAKKAKQSKKAARAKKKAEAAKKEAEAAKKPS